MRSLLAASLLFAATLNAAPETRHSSTPPVKWYVSVVMARGCTAVRVFGRTKSSATAYNNCIGATLGVQAQKDGVTSTVMPLESGR